MARKRQIQHRFTQGEIDPRMLGRSDIDQYYGAAETMRNVFPLPQGGFTRRPGLKYIGRIANQITRNTGQTITCPEGGTTSNANDDNIATLVTTTNNISTTNPYVVVHYDLGSAKSIAFVDAVGASLTAGSSASEFKLQVSTDNSNWTTLGAVAMSTTAKTQRYRVMGTYRYVRFARIGATDLGTAKANIQELHVWIDSGTLSDARLIDFVFSTSQTYMLVFTSLNIAIYKDGVLQADVRAVAHNSTHMEALSWTQSQDTLLLFHNLVPSYKLQRDGSDVDWVYTIVQFDYTPYYDFDPTSSNPAFTLTPSATSGNITLTTSGGFWSGGTHEHQYVTGNGGRARIIAVSSSTVATAVVEIPFFDTSAIASGAWTLESGFEAVWSATRGYPSCGVFHESRLWLAASTDRPSTVWGSRVGLYFDFDPGSVRDDDAIDATLDTGQFNKILNLYSGRTLLILTTGGEHAVLQSLNDPITPGNFNARRQTSIGSRENLRVVEAEGGVLYVQREGESVQEMVFDDTQQAFVSNITSLLASHLIITPDDFALRKATSTSEGNYLLIVNSDGTLTVACIQRSQLIGAFCPQETDGDFLRCGVDNGDMYFVIERSINGSTVRYLESFDFDYTTDCAKRSSSGVPASSFNGFDHLEGEEVKVVIDGEEVVSDTVASGTVTVGDIISAIHEIEILIPAGATSATQTIASVTTSRTAVFYNGFTTTHTGSPYREFIPRLELTNSTTVTAYRNTSSATHSVTVRGFVVEFSARAVQSVQHGTVTINSSAASGTATISSVTTARAVVVYLGQTVSTSTSSPQTVFSRVALTNATTVTANRGTSSTAVVTLGFCVIEWKSHIVNSIQARSVTITGTATESEDTIAEVNTARTMLIYQGVTATSSTLTAYLYRLALAASTIVHLFRQSANSVSRVVNYTAVEFKADVIELIQRGDTSLMSTDEESEDIQAINTSRGFLSQTGFSTNASSPDERFTAVDLVDSDTVRTERAGTGSSTSTANWQIIETEDSPDSAAVFVEAGLDYTVAVKDLPVENQAIGTAMGRKMNVSEINLRLYRTKNITVNSKRQSFNGFIEPEGNDDDNGFTGIKRIKGVRGWNLTGQVEISQDKPLPMTVLTLAKRVNT